MSKHSLFAEFEALLSTLSRELPAKTYSDCKATAHAYQEAKVLFYKSMQEAGLGSWVHNYDEVDLFELDLC